MSDKISDERLIEIMERRSPSLRWGEAENIAKELLARRAAEVKPVKFPKDMQMSDAVKTNISSDFMDGYNVRGVMDRKAVEAAGISVLSADPVAEFPPAST
ncbi:hypothetical protein [Rouxiella sp. WC2420]|uniref:Uncharacterized protein n=1 Tax=Rouxiella sp. WC2420 TaxID=3234145 RepID=A0AB39VLV6_9GAMM